MMINLKLEMTALSKAIRNATMSAREFGHAMQTFSAAFPSKPTHVPLPGVMQIHRSYIVSALKRSSRKKLRAVIADYQEGRFRVAMKRQGGWLFRYRVDTVADDDPFCEAMYIQFCERLRAIKHLKITDSWTGDHPAWFTSTTGPR